MIVDILKESILANIGPLKQAPKNWGKRHCMLCHTQGHGRDTRNRFGIQFNQNSILLNCFNCGFSAGYTDGQDLSKSFKFFLKNINLDDKYIKELEFEIFKRKNKIQSVRDGDEISAPDRETKLRSLFDRWHTRELPPGSLDLKTWLEYGNDDPEFLNVVNYVIGRKIYNLEEFYWTPEKTANLNQRVIIPYHYRGRIVGFTSRLYYSVADKSIPKYYQQCPTDFVYNIDGQSDWLRKYAILNEGVLDAWCVDGLSTLGELSQHKVDIINGLQKEIILCPDRDLKGGDLVEIAIENDWAVSFPKWTIDIKDAADASAKYGRLLTTHSVISSAIRGKDKIHLYWKITQSERARHNK